MRIRDWSSDVCSSDLGAAGADSILQSFAVVATDRNGSAANAPVDVRIVDEIGRASCRESVRHYVSLSVVAGPSKTHRGTARPPAVSPTPSTPTPAPHSLHTHPNLTPPHPPPPP